MELWIRSQDKESLIKVEKIELIYDYLCSEDIQLIHIETDKGRIGSYSTLERALEVLDEIHQRLINIQFIEITGADYITNQMRKNGNDIVYEMPKD